MSQRVQRVLRRAVFTVSVETVIASERGEGSTGTTHHIKSTKVFIQPEACRLAPDKLHSVKTEFDLLLQEEINDLPKDPSG